MAGFCDPGWHSCRLPAISILSVGADMLDPAIHHAVFLERERRQFDLDRLADSHEADILFDTITSARSFSYIGTSVSITVPAVPPSLWYEWRYLHHPVPAARAVPAGFACGVAWPPPAPAFPLHPVPRCVRVELTPIIDSSWISFFRTARWRPGRFDQVLLSVSSASFSIRSRRLSLAISGPGSCPWPACRRRLLLR